MRPALAVSPVQCIGAKTVPGATRSVTSARSTARRPPAARATRSAGAMPRAAASAGWISANGSAMCWLRRGARPVRVIVCHWSRMRPVLRRERAGGDGLRARRSGASGRGGRGVKKPPSAKKRSGPPTGHCTGAIAS